MYSTYYWKIFHLTWATFRWTLPPPPCTALPSWSALAKNRKILHLAMLCTCKKLSRWQIVFPTRKGHGAKWKTANAPLTDWQCQGGREERKKEAKCDAWRQIKRQWDSAQTGPHTSSSIYLSFPLSLSLSIARNKLENYCFCFRYTWVFSLSQNFY